MSEAELYKKILNKWGLPAQLGQTQEECAELIVAINKSFRGKPRANDMICEELADVQNMINQLKPLYPNFKKVRLEKLERIKTLLDIPKVKPAPISGLGPDIDAFSSWINPDSSPFQTPKK